MVSIWNDHQVCLKLTPQWLEPEWKYPLFLAPWFNWYLFLASKCLQYWGHIHPICFTGHSTSGGEIGWAGEECGILRGGSGIEASNDRVVLIRIHVSASDFTHILVGMPIMFIYVDDTWKEASQWSFKIGSEITESTAVFLWRCANIHRTNIYLSYFKYPPPNALAQLFETSIDPNGSLSGCYCWWRAEI